MGYLAKKAVVKSKKDLIKTLDRVFSQYIRLSAADDCGYVRCITCGSVHIWNDGNLHNGHFISRSVEVTRFDETNCHCQCVRCNSFRSGEHHIYRDRLIQMYGKDEVEKLEMKARLGGKLDESLLQEMIKEYREKVKQLKNEKGLK